MPPVEIDARLADLVFLDVLDVRADGTLRLNASFVARCIAAYTADPASIDTVIADHIVAQAGARGVPLLSDPQELALAALEIEASNAPSA